MNNAVSISIITINYNNSSGLDKTIQSVINQTYSNYEYIIIDGGSTDDSVDIIKKYQQYLPYWVSEKDNGIYHAMNKGIRASKGEYLLMLNSGDYLVDETVLERVALLGLQQKIVYGNVIWDDGRKKFNGYFPSNLTFKYFIDHSLGHQAAFIKRSVHDVVGLYDESLKIVSDWKLFILAICRFNLTHKHIPISISICSRDGISCLPSNTQLINLERQSVLQNEFPLFTNDYKEAVLNKKKLNYYQSFILVRVIRKLKKMINCRF
jgi:glycosyltransferase involved in cell wall biosynthesis